MSEVKKLVEKWRNQTATLSGAGTICADELEAALAAEPRVSEEQVRELHDTLTDIASQIDAVSCALWSTNALRGRELQGIARRCRDSATLLSPVHM